MAVKLKTKYAKKKNPGPRPGIKRTGKGKVTIHNTGNSSKGANALAHANLLLGGYKNKQISWHECVDDTYAYKSIPLGEKAWHAGDGGNGPGNNTYGIEICMDKDGNLLAATDNAAYRAAKILKYYKEKKAVSGKNLFQHNHWTGKDCPQMIRDGKPYSWSKFVEKVNWYLDALWGKKAESPDNANKKLVAAKKWAVKRATIRRGSSKKSEVKLLQKLLKKLDLYKGRIDGIWGSGTEAAFDKAQKKYKLVRDSICGIKSWTELKRRAS